MYVFHDKTRFAGVEFVCILSAKVCEDLDVSVDCTHQGSSF